MQSPKGCILAKAHCIIIVLLNTQVVEPELMHKDSGTVLVRDHRNPETKAKASTEVGRLLLHLHLEGMVELQGYRRQLQVPEEVVRNEPHSKGFVGVLVFATKEPEPSTTSVEFDASEAFEEAKTALLEPYDLQLRFLSDLEQGLRRLPFRRDPSSGSSPHVPFECVLLSLLSSSILFREFQLAGHSDMLSCSTVLRWGRVRQPHGKEGCQRSNHSESSLAVDHESVQEELVFPEAVAQIR